MRVIIALLLAAFITAGCSSPPEKKIIPRSELENMPVVEKEAPQDS